MKKDIKNIAHSIHQRLLNKARETSQPFNAIFQHWQWPTMMHLTKSGRQPVHGRSKDEAKI